VAESVDKTPNLSRKHFRIFRISKIIYGELRHQTENGFHCHNLIFMLNLTKNSYQWRSPLMETTLLKRRIGNDDCQKYIRWTVYTRYIYFKILLYYRLQSCEKIKQEIEKKTPNRLNIIYRVSILCPRLGAEWIGRISWLPMAPLGPIFMIVGTVLWTEYRPVIKITHPIEISSLRNFHWLHEFIISKVKTDSIKNKILITKSIHQDRGEFKNWSQGVERMFF